MDTTKSHEEKFSSTLIPNALATKLYRLVKNRDIGCVNWISPNKCIKFSLECLVMHRESCKVFIESVLPMSRSLELEWRQWRYPELTLDTKRCRCGKLFVRISNQKYCLECAEVKKQEARKKAVREHRKRARMK